MKPSKKLHLGVLLLGLIGWLIVPNTIRSLAPTNSWYVSSTGNNNNSCFSPLTACATLQVAINKATAGDTVYVAVGNYTDTGNEVLLVTRSVTLSGGWNTDFTDQIGMSVIDGQSARRGITVDTNLSVTINRFVIQNGAAYMGGGIYNDGSTVILNSSQLSDNSATIGGGIYNWLGTLTVNNSAVTRNFAGDAGGIHGQAGTVNLNNSTVSANRAQNYTGGIENTGNLNLNSSTIIDNSANNGTGGLANNGQGTVSLRNTILARNTSSYSPNCVTVSALTSLGYNLFGPDTWCQISLTTGDLLGVDPRLSAVSIGLPRYYYLFEDSPAINAGNPAGCMGTNGVLMTDQRGVARVGRCDIGAVEFAPPGSPSRITAVQGTPQRGLPASIFPIPLQAIVVDADGNPVPGVLVTFTAPSAGASGLFTDSASITTSAVTTMDGMTIASTFIANEIQGSYVITAKAADVITPTVFLLTNVEWYVASYGINSNSCRSVAAPCASINGVLNKPDFIAGDTVRVAVGSYFGSGAEVVFLNKSVILSGGWSDNFSVQNGASTINGVGTRRGITIQPNTATIIDRFVVENGASASGGGLFNAGILTLTRSLIRNNSATGFAPDYGLGGGLHNVGTAYIYDTVINANRSEGDGGGVYNNLGIVSINNTTISSNFGRGIGSGVFQNSGYGVITVNSSTIVSNTNGGIGRLSGAGSLKVQNSILYANAWGDCGGATSLGYNLFGSVSACSADTGLGDIIGVDPKLGSFVVGFPGYYPVSSDSPVINAGNPDGCKDSSGNILGADARGAPRAGRCDIGAYEFTPVGAAQKLYLVGGTSQYARPLHVFPHALQVLVTDDFGAPIKDITVTFSAPVAGASGIFMDTSAVSTTAVTNAGGIANSALLMTNDHIDAYEVSATISSVITPATFALENYLHLYIGPMGDDASNCRAPARACKSIDAVLARPDFDPGERILAATGTYTAADYVGVVVNRAVELSGGWNISYTIQQGMSVIDGENQRRGIMVTEGVTATLERFWIKNGYVIFDYINSHERFGGGIYNSGYLVLNQCAVSNNRALAGVIASALGGGIYNDGTLILNNTTVSDNHALGNAALYDGNGGGIYNGGGIVNLNNATLVNNVARNTVSGNGGGIYHDTGTTILTNTMIVHNHIGGDGPACAGAITSAGHNLIDDTSGCGFVSASGDLLNVIAGIYDPTPFTFYPLQPIGAAIDAGNTSGCTNYLGTPLIVDQRGTLRTLDGNGDGHAVCDIGAYEFDPMNPIEIFYTSLPLVVRWH